jgi:hypothetical protein
VSERERERAVRAEEFARRLKATGLGITEFQRRSGLTRNVIYNLSKGQAPSSPDQATLMNEAFERLTPADSTRA